MWQQVAVEALHLKNTLPISDVKRDKNWIDYDLNSDITKEWMHGWTNSDDWINFGLIYSGEKIPFASLTCPNTMKYLSKLKHVLVAGFSWLRPYGSIPPHTDENPDAITKHLGLIVPEGCFIFTDGEALKEENGKMIEFDSNKTHSAINASSKDRIVLYILQKEN